MLAQVNAWKLERFFVLMDTDGNGTLKLDDFVQSADTLSRVLGVPAGSAKHRELVRAYTEFWNHAAKPMDVDGDGQVTLDEFLTGHEQGVLRDPPGRDRIRAIAAAFLDLVDLDGSGYLDPNEFSTVMWEAFQVYPEQSAATFAYLDSDGNGQLSLDELAAAMEDFFCSADIKAKGNEFFGPF